MVFFCAFCHMVSCLGLWCCRVWWCAVVWCGSVTLCEALLASFYGFMVSSTSKVLKWLCGRSGASGDVSRCRLWSGGVVSCCLVVLSGVGALVLWLSVWLCVTVSGLWWCLVWLWSLLWLCGSSGVLCGGLFSGSILWVSSLVVWCCLFWWCLGLLWSGLLVSGHSIRNT